jgi:hypothetical protein
MGEMCRYNLKTTFCKISLLIIFCSVLSFCHSEWKLSLTKDSLPPQTTLGGIVFGNGHFFVGGYTFQRYTSPFPSPIQETPIPFVLTFSRVQSWKMHFPSDSIGSILPIYNVLFANNCFFAVQQPMFFSSTDGDSWNYGSFAGNFYRNPPVLGLAYKDSIYVAVGNSGIQTSSDGKSWTIQDSSRKYVSIVTGSKKFVVIDNSGNVRSSDDGQNWIDAFSVLNVIANKIMFCDNQFVIIGDSGTIAISKDAQSWTTARLPPGQWGWRDIVYGNNQFVAVGDNGMILTSSDALTWTKSTVDSSAQFYSVAYGDNIFAALARDNRVWYLKENKPDSLPVEFKKPTIQIDDRNSNFTIPIPDISLNGQVNISLFTCTGRKIREYSTIPINNTVAFSDKGLSSGKYLTVFLKEL